MAALLLAISWPAVAQRYVEVEPQLFRTYVTSSGVGIYSEGISEEVHQPNYSSTYQRLFVGPIVNLAVGGSIYHPNLFQYDLSGDYSPGYSWDHTTTSPGGTVNHNQFEDLRNFTGNAVIFANKPYRTSLFASSSHSFREYDFFNRVEVDDLRYGGHSGFSEGPVPVSFTVNHLDENTSGYGFTTFLRETTMDLEAHNDRGSGRTTFYYRLDDFDRTGSGSENVSGIEHTIGLTDTELFGSRKNIEWRNSVSYTKRDFTTAPGDVVTADSVLTFEHQTNLWSTYEGHYLRDELGDALSQNSDAGAGVQHRLYESLTSGLRLRVTHYTTEQPGSDFESTQYTVTWSENYTKRLSESARLTIGGSLGFSHTDQKSHSVVQIFGEAHTFTGGPFKNSFLLNVVHANPDSVRVFSQDRTILYVRDLDYRATAEGARTLIELIEPNGSGLTPTTQVIVDYEAAPQGTGEVDGQFEDFSIRLDLFNGMVGIYARYNNADYNAPSSIVVQDITVLAFGVDFYRKWLRAGAEYEIYDSTFSSYNAARFFQTFSFTPDDASSLSFTLSEGWTDYHTSHREEQYYSAIGRYHRGLTRHLGVDFEAGATERTGTIEDEFLAAVRPSVSYTIGKLSLRAGYEFEYHDVRNSEERLRHTFLFRAQRSF